MPKYPSFFRADEEINPSEHTSPSPNEWFGRGRTKFRSSPTFSEDSDNSGWRDIFHDHPSNPMKNDLLIDDTKQEALRFKDENNDARSLIFVLENMSEIFEAKGHIDLAAECENICELILSEEDDV